MTLQTMDEAVPFLYSSLMKAKPYQLEENDAITRAPHLTKELLDNLSLIPPKEKVILVTGSKGKGSISRMIAAILRSMGLKVGLFTSPHLVHFNERIRVNGKAISDEAFLLYLNRHKGQIDEVTSRIENPVHYLGPTGILLSVALAHFKDEHTDINVIEIGRGGTCDDTNVLNNKWAAVSKVMEEHIGYLGQTLKEITEHKLGIVKECTEHAVIGKQSVEALAIVQNKLDDRALFYGQDYEPKLSEMNLHGSEFEVKSKLTEYKNLFLPLLGSYQVENAAVAIQACECIVGGKIPVDIIRKSFGQLRWPGRLEIVDEDPVVLLDGSINRVSAAYLTEVLPLIDSSKVACIIAVPENKDYEGVIKVCSEFASILIVTTPDNSHKSFPKDALAAARKYHAEAIEVDLLSSAVKLVKDLNPTAIFIIGTQSMIGSSKEIWKDSVLEDIG
jgi:dihydrofolate synthase/folylpolyglutamate synthase